jgi:WhiB family transcriptional regulator, redox-sensing transcriptional regulator
VKVLPTGRDTHLFPLESDLEWRRDAACRGLGVAESQAIFFPAKGESIHAARAICHRCPVREPCLDFALTNNCIGVWGGTTGEERRRIRRLARTRIS